MKRVQVASFVRVGGEFCLIGRAVRHDGDCEYVPGAIGLAVDGYELLGQDLWDDINWLWPVMVQGLDECRSAGSAKRFFPDQPIAFESKMVGARGEVMLAVRTADRTIDRRAIAPVAELYEAVALAGLEFYENLRRLCGPGAVADEDERIVRGWLEGE
ncbi:hypothetical protein [Isoptericola nanjingensis]|uniref:hypothetical protein n=1 Tax=Isoptericola nanjingensis TaxID=903413 RepID=UPI003D2213D8